MNKNWILALVFAASVTASAADLVIALEVLAGYDPEDPTTGHRPLPDLSTIVGDRLDGIRVGAAPSLHLACEISFVLSLALLHQ